MTDIYVADTGNDTTGNGTAGNPYRTPGKAAGVAAAGDTIFLKYSATPYDVTTATPNVAGGVVNVSVGNDAGVTRLVGYDTNAAVGNTDANRPTIRLTVGSCTAVTLSTMQTEAQNVIVNCNSQTSSTAFGDPGGDYGSRFTRCKALNFTAAGFALSANYVMGAVACEATGGTSAATAGFYVSGQGGSLYGCVARANACPGFLSNANANVFLRSVAANNSGASSDGFQFGGASSAFHCTAYNNGRHGFYHSGYGRAGMIAGCLATGNAGYGFRIDQTGDPLVYLLTCAGYSNTSGNTVLATGVVSEGFVALSADPYANAAGDNFAPNATAGGGAAVRGAGPPGAFAGLSTTGYPDVGAAQHQDAGGGTTTYIFGSEG
jgi:hypothetical protein